MRYNFACVLSTHLGDKDGALKILEGVFALDGERYLKIAESDPDLDDIREDAGFRMSSMTPGGDSASPRRSWLLYAVSLDDLDLRVEHLALDRAFALGRRDRRAKILRTTSMPSVT